MGTVTGDTTAPHATPSPPRERRLRYPVLWVLFLMSTVGGAAMLFGADPDDDMLGIVLLALPLLVFGTVLALYYWKSRRVT